MGSSSYANFEAYEGTVSGEVEITFNRRPRRVIITNDNGGGVMEFKFNDTESLGTLNPTETITLDIICSKIILRGSGVDYRVWGLG